ncbi:hypothetical protein SARC_09029 [Sphaeroforma arctica JP610]|uniref:Uncharacterized protein n=1 Tax=Sphaeroforma arctica JP610 TaxID=667725 RepID=A0A0L0FNY1_9EUKA|nr:hypothetical protein SARC_09029 [Sphaeroforma arctica JP610]KNC78545.1 hypothetical protein SARC_09029 [Sphaeroforma arctica JP610]|eukprot:XP_014152447.1 hypothetical protein SARC_09029 [Sphaeroforma arctica JP610]
MMLSVAQPEASTQLFATVMGDVATVIAATQEDTCTTGSESFNDTKEYIEETQPEATTTQLYSTIDNDNAIPNVKIVYKYDSFHVVGLKYTPIGELTKAMFLCDIFNF